MVTCNMHLRRESQYTLKKGGGGRLEPAQGSGMQVHPMAPRAVMSAHRQSCMHAVKAKMLQQRLPGMYVE